MKLILDFSFFRKPLRTKHHEGPWAKHPRRGRPRPKRRFDWTCVRTEALMTKAEHAAWRKRVYLWHLWLYTRDAAGEPMGRLICFGWVRAVKP